MRTYGRKKSGCCSCCNPTAGVPKSRTAERMRAVREIRREVASADMSDPSDEQTRCVECDNECLFENCGCDFCPVFTDPQIPNVTFWVGGMGARCP